MKPISTSVKKAVIERAKMGDSSRKIANYLKISQRSVLRIIKKDESIDQNQNLNKNKGRPKKISATEAKKLGRLLTTGRIKSTKEAVSMCTNNVSRWTVQRALKSVGYKANIKKKKPKISAKNLKARKMFLSKYESWTVVDWQTVILQL